MDLIEQFQKEYKERPYASKYATIGEYKKAFDEWKDKYIEWLERRFYLEDQREAAIEEGYRRGITQIYVKTLRELADCGVNVDKDYLIAERQAVINILRRICSKHGDNDWEDNLHIGNIIEKHLERYLDK